MRRMPQNKSPILLAAEQSRTFAASGYAISNRAASDIVRGIRRLMRSSPPIQPLLDPFCRSARPRLQRRKVCGECGIGARTVWGCRIYGANVYYDYRNTHKTNAYRNSHQLHYNQVGGGLETLGERWDVRVNGYFPLGKSKSGPYDPQFAGFVGNGVRVKRKYQVGMTGVDGEFGVHFGKNIEASIITPPSAPTISRARSGKRRSAAKCAWRPITKSMSP